MNKENDYIDKLYSEKFDNFEDQTSDSDWISLNSKLSKSNFLRFSFVTFNIFYLAVLLMFAGTSTYLGVSNIIYTKEIQKLEEKIKVLQQQSDTTESLTLTTDSITIENKVQKTEIKRENSLLNNKEIQASNIEYKSNTSIDKALINTSKDSVYLKPDSISVSKTIPVKINKVKKTIFVKQDKVIVKDTVVIKKK
jgi:hypothetical protein